LQKLSKEARAAACFEIGMEIDIENAQPSLFLNVLNNISPNHDKSLLKKYCTYFKEWRQCLADYFSIS